MSVRKRKWKTRLGEARAAWVVDYVDRQGDRHIETFAKKKEADVRHAEVNVDVQTGVHVPASKSVTLAEAAEIWLEAAKLEGLERGTLLQYQGHLKHILPVLGRVKLSDLASADVATFADGLRKGGMSPAMTNKVLTSLGSLIAEAQTRDSSPAMLRAVPVAISARVKLVAMASSRSAWTSPRRTRSRRSCRRPRGAGGRCYLSPPSPACARPSFAG